MLPSALPLGWAAHPCKSLAEGCTGLASLLWIHSEYLLSRVLPGVQTGNCIKYNGSIKTCEIYAWCPVEDDTNVPR